MYKKEITFLDYLGYEKKNLLTSLVNFRREYEFFHELDSIFQEPLKRLDIPESESLIPQLYLFVHFHLYFSTSCILRSHLSECFASVRKAIDATLSAYRIIIDPSTSEQYINRHKDFRFIKRYMENEARKDHSKYPLAQELIKLHEMCSRFGSHADVDSFIHRLEMREIEGTKKVEQRLRYFQFPKNEKEYRFYFISMIKAFWLMFKIFYSYYEKQLKIINPKWDLAIETLGPKLDKLAKQFSPSSESNRISP